MPYERMSMWKNVSPRGAVGDLVHEWRKPNPYRWQILLISILATFVIGYMFVPRSERVEPRSPEVTYITTFAPGRSQAEIRASNLALQQRQDARLAEEAARTERRKQFFRTLGRATGLDVDALEKQYADDPKAPPAPARSPVAR
jgi:hypothetical protein